MIDPTPIAAETQRAAQTLLLLCPEAMRAQFAPLVEIAIAGIPADSLSKLVSDLESTREPNGDINVDKLIVIGKQFGLTDEMIDGYRASYAAMPAPAQPPH